MKGQNKIKICDASLDRQPKVLSSSEQEILYRIMEQTNNDCRNRGMYLFPISYGSDAMDQGSGVG